MRLWLKNNAGVLARDGLGIAGAGLLTYGVQLMHVPAAFVVAGALLLFASWRLSRAS
jgi:hypothetical protein